MTRLIVAVVCGLGVLALPFGPLAVAAHADGACGTIYSSHSCPAETTVDSIRYEFDGSAFRRLPAFRAAEASGVEYRYWYTPACSGNYLSGSGEVVTDTSCNNAAGATACARPAQILMFVYREAVGRPGSRRQQTSCFGPSDTIRLADVRAALREQLEKRLPRPAMRVQPAGTAIVNLPVIVSARQDGVIGFAVTLPLPGRVAARPSYQWSFGGGNDAAAGAAGASGAGRVYDGTSPRTSPGYYVDHTYTRPGQSRVTLTVRWDATFTVAGLPAVRLDPVVFDESRTVTVKEARTELVAGGH